MDDGKNYFTGSMKGLEWIYCGEKESEMDELNNLTRTWVVRLVIITVIVFMVQMLTGSMPIYMGDAVIPFSRFIDFYFGLSPKFVIEKFALWQFVTYIFIHGNFLHILFNMYTLFICGMPVEHAWGGRRFLFYYLFTGIGAGLTIFVINWLVGGPMYESPTIGASGAVFGILLAFGMLYPNVEILVFFVLPMKAKYFVVILGLIELYTLFQAGFASPISHTGHLGGILFGLIYFAVIRKHDIKFKSKLIKARLKREFDRRELKAEGSGDAGHQQLLQILRKVKASGADSLTDDEYQLLRYKMIMVGDASDICVEDDFDTSDEYCLKCKNIDACLIREIKKYLS